MKYNVAKARNVVARLERAIQVLPTIYTDRDARRHQIVRRVLVMWLNRARAGVGGALHERELQMRALAGPFTPEMRSWVRAFPRCMYCGHVFDPKERHIGEHIMPTVLGGTTTPDNIVVACGTCNSRKGGRIPSDAGMRLMV